MDEDSTTASGAITGAEASAQPDTNAFGEAAAAVPEPTTTNVTDTPETQVDDNVAWLQNKGIDPSDPDAMAKVAKMYRDAEKAMHEARQPKLNEALAAPVEAQDQYLEEPDQMTVLQQQVEEMQLRTVVTDFFAADGNAELAGERKALEPQMAQVVAENPAIGQMVKTGYMSYEQLAALAKGSDPTYGAQLRQDGGREALQQVAEKAQARAVPGMATTSAVAGDTKGDPFRDGFNSVK